MRLLENDAPSSLSKGLPNTELLQYLGRLMSDALDHINSCANCRQKGYGVCTLCYSGSKRGGAGSGGSVANINASASAGSDLSSSPVLVDIHDDANHNNNLQDKVAFWEDGTACDKCGAIYHASCYELRGCPKCKK